MEIRHFITFRTIVELGSFTRASEHLGYAQSSITSHIQALESNLGAQLFDRVGKNISLTDTGNQLLKYTNELLSTYEKIEHMKYDQNNPSGTIKIGAPETLLIYRLNSIFKQYKKEFPQVKIIIKDVSHAKLREALHKGELDLAFILDSKISDSDLIIEELIEEKMCLVLPPDYSLDDKDSISENLAAFFTEKGCSYRYIFEEYLQSNAISTENVMETWSIETIKKCAMNGIAISLLPLITIIDDLKANNVSVSLLELEQKKMISQIAYHKNKWISPALKKFIELTLQHSKQWTAPNI
ncbi:LysR family transcriptional regulator [Wukongibacter baidiensis]|uniref:LysR family transcriptional regulator n=1 Tax=Wukongibacter baidiensis TaxID=1723361 RepID=UPI003D7FF0A1